MLNMRLDKFFKIGFGLAALFVLIFGFIHIKQMLRLSFPEQGKEETTQTGGTASTAGEEQQLKSADTDSDGLSDWDELNVYHTSPYLPDSDSDKISDYDEVKAGTDPNCPQGRECGSNMLEQLKQQLTASSTAAATSNENSTEQGGNSIPVELTPDEIRALLKQGGVTDEQLQGATDEELLQVYEEAKKEAGSSQP